MLKYGAVTAVAATRVSWYHPGQTDVEEKDGTNMSISYQFAKAVIGDDKSVSEALSFVRNTLDPGIIYWMNWTDYVIYGDPSVKVSTCSDSTAAGKIQAVDNLHCLIISSDKHGLLHIQFFLPRDMAVTLTVFDAAGREVAAILNEKLSKGKHSIAWDTKQHTTDCLAAGLYFVTFDTELYKKVERIPIVK